MEKQTEKIFMETLRFGDLGIIHSKKYHMDSKWEVNRVLNNHELYFVFGGSFRLLINGENYSVNENKLVLIPANTYKDIYIPRGSYADFFSLQFTSNAGGTSYFSKVPLCSPIDITEHQNEVMRLFTKMTDIGEPMTHSDVFKRIGCAGELLSIFFEHTDNEVILPETKSKIDFQKSISHIDRFYRYRKIPIAELAKITQVSEGYFRREFKKQFGISCKMYINSKRMTAALQMLRESNAPLDNIADSFMYTNASYLSREIKKATGLSPTEYRKKHKK